MIPFADMLKMTYTGGMSIPRSDMPQIRDINKFIRFLAVNDVKCELVKLDPASIKPTQKDFNLDKVLTLVDSSVDKPIIVSVDGYVLDGHHRYLAELVKGKPHLVNMYQCSASINNLLHLVKDYKE